jgi:dihydroorotate dehydrogenase (fumarate)
MNLQTKYLGLDLKNPIIPSASPLSKNVDIIKRMEDTGAAAVVLHSLFEEQIKNEQLELQNYWDIHSEKFQEATSFYPDYIDYKLGPDEYLDHIKKVKDSVKIPVIASLNGSTPGGWIEYSKLIQEAGADALELNIYLLAADISKTANEIENIYTEILKSVKETINIPVCMKLSPYFSSFSNFAMTLDENGADGLLLFNRFYQPDIDLEALEVIHSVELSNRQSLRLPLRWIAILYNKIKADIAATSGVHTAEDVIKLTMVGAKAVQMFAALHINGIQHISKILKDIESWMTEHEYDSLDMMRGSMSYESVSNPGSFERANYMKILSTFNVNF